MLFPLHLTWYPLFVYNYCHKKIFFSYTCTKMLVQMHNYYGQINGVHAGFHPVRGGGGEASPPKHAASTPPPKKGKEREKEREERAVCACFLCYDILDHFKTCWLSQIKIHNTSVSLMVIWGIVHGVWSCHGHFHPKPKFLDKTLTCSNTVHHETKLGWQLNWDEDSLASQWQSSAVQLWSPYKASKAIIRVPCS